VTSQIKPAKCLPSTLTKGHCHGNARKLTPISATQTKQPEKAIQKAIQKAKQKAKYIGASYFSYLVFVYSTAFIIISYTELLGLYKITLKTKD
jgi:hypothetical protein